MPLTLVTILGQQIAVDCADCDQRRVEDLAAALSQRLARFSGAECDMHRLVLTALSLLDETQAKGAALALARGEIERLTDLLVEARLDGAASGEPVIEERGRVGALQP